MSRLFNLGITNFKLKEIIFTKKVLIFLFNTIKANFFLFMI